MKAPTPSIAKITSFLVNLSGAKHPEEVGIETYFELTCAVDCGVEIKRAASFAERYFEIRN